MPTTHGYAVALDFAKDLTPAEKSDLIQVLFSQLPDAELDECYWQLTRHLPDRNLEGEERDAEIIDFTKHSLCQALIPTRHEDIVLDRAIDDLRTKQRREAKRDWSAVAETLTALAAIALIGLPCIWGWVDLVERWRGK